MEGRTKQHVKKTTGCWSHRAPLPLCATRSRCSFALQLLVFAGLSLHSLICALGSRKPVTVSLLSPGVVEFLTVLVYRKGMQRQPEHGLSQTVLIHTLPLLSLCCPSLCVPSWVLTSADDPQPALAGLHESKSHHLQGLQVLITFVSHHKNIINKWIIWSCVSNLLRLKSILETFSNFC